MSKRKPATVDAALHKRLRVLADATGQKLQFLIDEAIAVLLLQKEVDRTLTKLRGNQE
jgi:predicted transcriptional regulator